MIAGVSRLFSRIAHLFTRRAEPEPRVLPVSLDPREFAPVPEGGYLVGGAVRDALLGRPQADLDWLVAQPERAASLAARLLDGAHFALDEARGHWRVVAGDVVRDYIRFDSSLEDDLRSRDYTVNALAMDTTGRIVDVTGGLADLSSLTLRMVSSAALRSDPLRLLRAARLSAQHGLRIEPGTQEAIRTLAAAQLDGRVPTPAFERVRVELDQLMMTDQPAGAVGLLDDLGLLDVYLPELTMGRGVEQGGFHHLDVMQHQIEALGALIRLFPDADLGLRYATLLHDVGKPDTAEADEEGGRVRFYGHDRLGAEMATGVMRRLRQPTMRRERVAGLVRRHMLPLPATEKSTRRFIHRYRELLPDLLKLMIADREAARGRLASEAARRKYREALGRVIEMMNEAPEPAAKPLLDGTELMELLELAPGPRVGEAARYLAELQAVGDADTEEEAVRHLRRYAAAQGWISSGDGASGAGQDPQEPEDDEPEPS